MNQEVTDIQELSLDPQDLADRQGAAADDLGSEYLDRLDAAIESVSAAGAALTDGGSAIDRGVAVERPMDLSVVIPVFNERETIRTIVQRVQSVGLHREIVIVDDCSTDGTRDVLRELASQPDVRVMYHDVNQGKGAALRTGFGQAEGEFVLIQDADLEYDPADYPYLLAPLAHSQAEVVYGSRFLANWEQDPSWLHRFGNRLLTAASNVFTGERLTDMETCYKVFRRSVLEGLFIQQNRFGFEPEITAKLARRGVAIVEVPIRYCGRSYDEGKKIGVRDGLNALYCIVRYALRD